MNTRCHWFALKEIKWISSGLLAKLLTKQSQVSTFELQDFGNAGALESASGGTHPEISAELIGT